MCLFPFSPEHSDRMSKFKALLFVSHKKTNTSQHFINVVIVLKS